MPGAAPIVTTLTQLFGDVLITNPTQGQVLTFDEDSGFWINADPTGGTGGGTTSPSFFRPDGSSRYHRGDGTSLFLRP